MLAPKSRGPLYRYHFNCNNLPPPCQFLGHEILLKNKIAREMLIEQIVEFKLRGPGPLGHTCTPTTGYVHDKTKSFMVNL